MSGKIIRWFGTNTDITDLRQTQEALHQSQEQLELANRDLEQKVVDRTAKLRETVQELESYSYSISHDMRAPLRAMQAYAQVLIDDLGPGLGVTNRRYLDRISAAANRLDKLITDVLSYSRLSSTELDLQSVNLDRLVEEIAYQYPALQNASLEIAPHLGTVMAAEALLTQAIANLLTNAVKFVPPGIKPCIRIWSEAIAADRAPSSTSSTVAAPVHSSPRSFIRLVFQDNGIGIAPQDHARIFSIFTRVHSEKEYEGTGIGLSIVKKAVERMGGSVGLESEVGKGSRFWIELPGA